MATTKTAEERAEEYIRSHSDFKTEGFSDFQNGKLIGFIDGINSQSAAFISEVEAVKKDLQNRYDIHASLRGGISKANAYNEAVLLLDELLTKLKTK